MKHSVLLLFHWRNVYFIYIQTVIVTGLPSFVLLYFLKFPLPASFISIMRTCFLLCWLACKISSHVSMYLKPMFACFICVNFSLSLSLHREKRLLNFTSNNWRRRALPTCPAGHLLLPPPRLTPCLSAQPELSQHAAAELTPAPRTSCQALRMVRWIIVLTMCS